MNPNRQTIDNPTGNGATDALRGVPSQAEIDALRERNASRAKVAIRNLGPLYCCHPKHNPNRVQPKPAWTEPPRYLRRA